MASGLASVDPQKTIDHYDLDDGDANFPIFVPYIAPAQISGVIRITLSWFRKPFRATASLNPSSMTTDASGSSGHSHSHAHTIPIGSAGGSSAVQWSGAGNGLQSSPGISGNTSAINSDASGESGHTHSHSHTLTGSSSLVVTEGGTANVTAIAFDGLDRTAILGGPWTGDVVELDITALCSMTQGSWHQIALSLSGQGRLVTLMRVYYTTS